jgi:hypothetical protein
MTTVMGSNEVLSDEELARRLQAEFLSEEFGTVEDEELMKTLADQLQRQQEDEAYAKKIQEEYDREAHVEPPYYSTYTSPTPGLLSHPSPNQFLFAPYSSASPQTHSKVLTSVELRNKTDDWSPVARTVSTQEKNLDSEREEDDEFQCLICYESPDGTLLLLFSLFFSYPKPSSISPSSEYIVLPMCKTPHIYCMECAERLYQQTNTSRIQCPLCSVVTPVDSGRGLRGLRRRRKKA